MAGTIAEDDAAPRDGVEPPLPPKPRHAFDWFDEFWDPVCVWARTLWICRASVASVLIGAAFLQTAPLRDILVGLAQDAAGGDWTLYGGWLTANFFLAAFFWAASLHYCARVLLYLDIGLLPEPGPERERYRKAFTRVPRLLGVAVFIAIAVAQIGTWSWLNDWIERLAFAGLLAGTVVTGVIFWFYATYRAEVLGFAQSTGRRISVALAGQANSRRRRGGRRLMRAMPGSHAFVKGVVAVRRLLVRWLKIRPQVTLAGKRADDVQPVFIPSAARNRTRDPPDLADLGKNSLAWRRVTWTLFVILIVGFGTSLAAMIMPLKVAAFATQAGVLFLILGAWVPFFSVLAFIAQWRRIPALVGVLVLSSLAHCGLGIDNHTVRLAQNDSTTDRRPELAPALKSWASVNSSGAQAIKPLIIVATAGGGSRAAFWTATVLGAFQDIDHNFRNQVFAISAVSGGALGAATWSGILHRADELKLPEDMLCKNLRDQPVKASAAQATTLCGQAVTAGDFLAPTFVSLGFQDAFFRLVPIKFAEDRAVTIEWAWEAEWRNITGEQGSDGMFARSFRALGPTAEQTGGWYPALMFNGTSVHTGKRIVTSQIRVENGGGRIFTDAYDLFDLIEDGADGRLRLSTAITFAARFPLVLPAGTLRGGKDCPKGAVCHRIVDGGYFENFGAVTAGELLAAVSAQMNGDGRLAAREAGKSVKIVPIVIQISSDPSLSYTSATPSHRTDDEPGLLSGLTAPPLALWQTRSARGELATIALEQRVKAMGGHYVHLRLTDPKGAAPLSWWLSRAAQTELDSQLCSSANLVEYKALDAFLAKQGATDNAAKKLQDRCAVKG